MCGGKALAGAKHCHHCGLALPQPGGSQPKLLACYSCGHKALPPAAYCAQCGESLVDPDQAAAFDPDERRACPDGLCIGILGADGRCTECGKPGSPSAPLAD
jgi:hypothetical protein